MRRACGGCGLRWLALAGSARGAVFADSLPVRRDHEVTAGMGVAWFFATSGRLVGTDD
jgi:hypothetical protein